MTKRVTKSFIVMLVSFCLLLAAMALSFATTETVKADGEGASAPVPAETYVIGASSGSLSDATYVQDMANGWKAAVAKSIALKNSEATNTLVRIVLAADWEASPTADSTSTTFGVSEDYGYILADSGSNIELDLNGHVIDRKLSSAVDDGYIMKVLGEMTIKDSSASATHLNGSDPVYTYETRTEGDATTPYIGKPVTNTVTGGVITGGNNTGNGSGIVVGAAQDGDIDGVFGKLVILGGTVYGNITNGIYGGGVYVASGNLEMRGGAVVKNKVLCTAENALAYGAGITLSDGCKFDLYDGVIAENFTSSEKANAYGGGVSLMGTPQKHAVMNMLGGKINNNEVAGDLGEKMNKFSYGGGIFVSGADLDISGGEISDNRVYQYYDGEKEFFWNACGGAVGGWPQEKNITEEQRNKFTMRGGKLIRNIAAFGGAVNLYGDSVYSGGIIENNSVLSKNGWESIGGIRFNATISSYMFRGSIVIRDNYELVFADKTIKKKRSIDIPYNTENKNGDHDAYDFSVGKLNDDAYIGVYASDWCTDRQADISKQYTVSNGREIAVNDDKYYIPANPSKYFHNERSASLDGGTGKFLLNDSGEISLAYITTKAIFVVEYTDGTAETYDYDTCDYYGTAFAYGDKQIKKVLLNGVEVTADKAFEGVGCYKYSGEIGLAANLQVGAGETDTTKKKDLLKTAFTVVVTPKTLTASDITATVGAGELVYDGQEKRPECTVSYKGKALTKDTDFVLSYERNVNAGTANAVLTFRGNYGGTVKVPFEISSATDVYEVAWSYKNGEEWSSLSSDTKLTFRGTSLRDEIRAQLSLTSGGTPIFVYARGNAENTTNMYIEIKRGDAESDLLSVGVYSLEINGVGNHTLPETKTASIEIVKAMLGITASNFSSGADGDGNRLWILSFENKTSNLRDKATFVVDGNKVEGNEDDAYARYRGVDLTLALNPEYTLASGVKLRDIIGSKTTLSYTSNTARGENNKKTDISSSVAFTFGSDYADEGFTLSKRWHIVTINNDIRNNDGSETTGLGNVTYSVSTGVRTLRPEHGDRVIFTFRSGNMVLSRVGVIYSDNVSNSYGVIDIAGKPAIDVAQRYPDNYYFNTVLNGLGAGGYTLDVYIPEFTSSGSHTHWWETDSEAHDDSGVVYYAVNESLNFSVLPYDIAETGVSVKKITASVVTEEVAYTAIPTPPEVRLTFGGKTLVAGTDYVVSTNNIVAGEAVVTVTGRGNFGGSLSLDFTIVQAENDWIKTPNIIHWVYDTFNREINVVSSEPRYKFGNAQVTYSVVNEKRESVGAALTDFRVDENGMVAAAASLALASLDCGRYYLIAKLPATDSYGAIDTTSNPLEFNVLQATNTWLETPNIINWAYSSFDKEVNRIRAVPQFSANGMVSFAVSTDAEGKNKIAGLESFTVTGGKVTDAIAAKLNAMKVGKYYLSAWVDGHNNYTALSAGAPIEFNVSKAMNYWAAGNDDLKLPSWIVGEYSETENPIVINARNGKVNVIVTDVDGNEYYNSVKGVNNLNECKIGKYLLKAWVDESADYAALAERTFTIEVLKKIGLPWWGTALISLGSLLTAALVLFILWKKGVFEIMTDKIVLAIKTKMSVDATIASVRAAKRMEEGKKSVADAKRRERIEEARKKAEEIRNLPPDERAAQLEARAQIDAERAEKIRARSEHMQARAAKLRKEKQPETQNEKPADETAEPATEE